MDGCKRHPESKRIAQKECLHNRDQLDLLSRSCLIEQDVCQPVSETERERERGGGGEMIKEEGGTGRVGGGGGGGGRGRWGERE